LIKLKTQGDLWVFFRPDFLLSHFFSLTSLFRM
jgi:hypothetical protein